MLVAVAFQAFLFALTLPLLTATLRFLLATVSLPGSATPASSGVAYGASSEGASKVASLSVLAAWVVPASVLVLAFATVPATRALMLAGLLGLAARTVVVRRLQRASLRLL